MHMTIIVLAATAFVCMSHSLRNWAITLLKWRNQYFMDSL